MIMYDFLILLNWIHAQSCISLYITGHFLVEKVSTIRAKCFVKLSYNMSQMFTAFHTNDITYSYFHFYGKKEMSSIECS